MVAVTRYCFDSPNPVTKTILLQEFFGKIFKISFRKRNSRGNRDLGVTLITVLLKVLGLRRLCLLTVAGNLDIIT